LLFGGGQHMNTTSPEILIAEPFASADVDINGGWLLGIHVFNDLLGSLPTNPWPWERELHLRMVGL
jgi:hypothetical protein